VTHPAIVNDWKKDDHQILGAISRAHAVARDGQELERFDHQGVQVRLHKGKDWMGVPKLSWTAHPEGHDLPVGGGEFTKVAKNRWEAGLAGLQPSVQGKGIYTAAIKALRKHANGTLVPSKNLSPGAIKAWQRAGTKVHVLESAPVTEATNSTAFVTSREWHHGDTAERHSFDDQRMDRDRRHDGNALGPGIYFTSDHAQARGYAHPSGHVYTAKIDARRVINHTTKPTRTFLRKLIDAAPADDKESGLSNWAEHPHVAKVKAVEAYMKEPSLLHAVSGIHHDFYANSPDHFAKAMVSLGVDAYHHDLDAVNVANGHDTAPKEGVHHLVVYNPRSIRVTKAIAHSATVAERIAYFLKSTEPSVQ
jgi:hypothetical protein